MITEVDRVMEATWVPVTDFSGYSVNPLGQVRNDSTGRLLNIRINQYGVAYICPMRNGHQVCRSLPLLIASTFIPQPNDIFDTPINKDGDRSNCHVDNLAWRPRWYAVFYNRQFEERYENPINAPVRNVETGQEFSDSFSAACFYGILEREVVLSIFNNTIAFPIFQQFELAE
jgi:hypothetical protein